MTKGLFLTIGLNAVDPARYGGWDGKLNACENDARDLAAMAAGAGCTGKTLLTTEATATKVLAELQRAAKQLGPGDLFVLGYSGHGSQIGDVTADESDQLDETWCLYDRMFVDDELYAMWSRFSAGVRIFVLSDSCHSGTVTKMEQYRSLLTASDGASKRNEPDLPTGKVKALPFAKAWNLYQDDKALYDSLQYVAGPAEKAIQSASVILISGCQDNQLSLDGESNGLFTGTLKKVWASGAYKGNYAQFRRDIVELMPPSQTPNYYVVGASNLAFEAQAPFTL